MRGPYELLAASKTLASQVQGPNQARSPFCNFYAWLPRAHDPGERPRQCRQHPCGAQSSRTTCWHVWSHSSMCVKDAYAAWRQSTRRGATRGGEGARAGADCCARASVNFSTRSRFRRYLAAALSSRITVTFDSKHFRQMVTRKASTATGNAGGDSASRRRYGVDVGEGQRPCLSRTVAGRNRSRTTSI